MYSGQPRSRRGSEDERRSERAVHRSAVEITALPLCSDDNGGAADDPSRGVGGEHERREGEAGGEPLDPLVAPKQETKRSYADEIGVKKTAQDGRVAVKFGPRPGLHLIIDGGFGFQ